MTTITLCYNGKGIFRALYPAKCEGLEPGSIAAWQTVEVRSGKSHRHYFAAVHQAWLNLPEHLVDEFPTSEFLRKWALIKAGYRKSSKVVCPTNAEAARHCAFISEMDGFAICEVDGRTATVHVAESQSIPAMGREKFQESKDAVFRVLSELIGSTVTETMEQAA